MTQDWLNGFVFGVALCLAILLVAVIALWMREE